jgi:hypothetical protein
VFLEAIPTGGTAHSSKTRKPRLDRVERRLVASHYTKLDRASNSVQLWRICAVFFYFLGFFGLLLP